MAEPLPADLEYRLRRRDGTIWFSGGEEPARPQFADVAGAQAVFDLLAAGQRRG